MVSFASDINDTSPENMRWWDRKLTLEQCAIKVNQAITKIRNAQSWREEADLQNLRLYRNAPILGFGVNNYTKPAAVTAGRVGLNVIKNCSDSFVAKITKDRPKATFVTSDADWELQHRAEEMERFIKGQVYELKVYDLIPACVLDECIFGTGVLHPYKAGTGKGMRLAIEKAPPWQFKVDDQEGLYGTPRSYFREMWFDREVLLASHDWDAKAAKAIKESKTEHEDKQQSPGAPSASDQVLVRHGWHIQSRPGMSEKETDGAYCIFLRNAVVWREPYVYDEPPFVWFRRQLPPLGFWGIGLAEELKGIQVELTGLLQKVSRSFHLLGGGHLLVEKNSRVNKHKLDNDIGTIWEYVNVKPELFAANPVPPQIFEHIEAQLQRAYNITGISQLEAQSMKPKGLNSGKAIDSYLDITTERFNVGVRLYYAAFLQLVEWIIRLTREIVDENPDFDVIAPAEYGMPAKRIAFKPNELRDDQYYLQVQATNALSDDFSERVEQVERMQNAGWIDPRTARRLTAHPDVERAQTLEDASYTAVEICIRSALRENKYRGPETFMDLGQPGQPGEAMKQVQLALLDAQNRGYPEERLVHLKDWLTDAIELVNQQNAPPPGMSPPAMPGSPGIAPVMPGQPIAPAAAPMAPAGMPPGTPVQ